MSEESKKIVEEIYGKIQEFKEDYIHDLVGDYAVTKEEKNTAKNVIAVLDAIQGYMIDSAEYRWM